MDTQEIFLIVSASKNHTHSNMGGTCVHVCGRVSVCVEVCTSEYRCRQRSEEVSVRFLRAGVRGDCEPLTWVPQTKLGSIARVTCTLNHKPSL